MKDDERESGESLPESHISERESAAPESANAGSVDSSRKSKRPAGRTQARASKAPPKSKPGKKSKKPAASANEASAPRAVRSPSAASVKSRRTPAPPAVGAKTLLDPVRPAFPVADISEDDISIPPASVSTDDLDEHDELFFAEGEAASKRAHELELGLGHAGHGHAPHVIAGRASSDDHVILAPPPRVVDHAHRKKLANYVKIAVGVSAVLCIAAMVRVGLSREPSADAHIAAASVAAVQSPAPVAVPAAPAIPPPPPVAAQPAAQPAPVAAAGAAAPIPGTPEAVAPPVSDKTAKQEKEDARKLLERGKAKDAIAAAERSVAIDPTDADAWLILGAARQDAGKHADARTAFVSCTKEAKTGPIGECRAMLTYNGPR